MSDEKVRTRLRTYYKVYMYYMYSLSLNSTRNDMQMDVIFSCITKITPTTPSTLCGANELFGLHCEFGLAGIRTPGCHYSVFITDDVSCFIA